MTSPVSAIEAIERFERAVAANGYRTRDDHTEAEYLAAKAALTASLSDQERAVEVKALEWRVLCSRSGNSEAKTPFGEYVIQSERDGWMLYLLNEQDAHMAYSTIDFAKAAAQADYEQRIRSALVDVPAVESEPVAWLDDGTLRSGSVSTARRVVTDEQKRDMPAAIASSFTIPLYLHPPLSREGEDSAGMVREELRAMMLEQKTSGSRETYTDGFAQGLCFAIERLDALAATRSGSAITSKGTSAIRQRGESE